jgi:paraquat-inducible protein B
VPRLVGLVAIVGLLLVFGFLALAASSRYFRQQRSFVVFFKNPVGLKAGAPVTFRQTPVGLVRHSELVFTGRGLESEIMVIFDIEKGSLRSIGQQSQLHRLPDKDFAAALAQAGLRGTVRSSSPVGGQKSLDFDFHPEVAGRLSGLPSPYAELPTGSVSRLDVLQDKVEKTLEKISELPLDAVVAQVQSTLESAQRLLDNGDLRGALANLRRTLDAAERMLARTGTTMDNVDGMLGDVRTTLSSAQETMKRLDTTMVTVDRNVERTAETQYRTIRSIDELNELLHTLRQLVDTLQQHPESLLQGKPAPKEKQ